MKTHGSVLTRIGQVLLNLWMKVGCNVNFRGCHLDTGCPISFLAMWCYDGHDPSSIFLPMKLFCRGFILGPVALIGDATYPIDKYM